MTSLPLPFLRMENSILAHWVSVRLDGSGVEDLVTGGLSEAQRLRVVEKELGMTQAALAEAKGALAEASARASEAGAIEKEAGMLRARLSEAQQAVANAGIEAGDLQAEVQKLREAARATEAAVAAAATCRMPATS